MPRQYTDDDNLRHKFNQILAHLDSLEANTTLAFNLVCQAMSLACEPEHKPPHDDEPTTSYAVDY